MKKHLSLVMGLFTLIFISCQKENLKPGKNSGTLIVDIGITLRVNEVSTGLKSTKQPEDFKVTIYAANGSKVMTFETASVMPDSIQLESGNYYVEAHSDNNLPAAFENPYYFGKSEVFTISPNTQQSVIVNCELANTIVSIVYSDTLKSSFTDFSTTVSSSLDSLVFSKGETRLGYFQTLPLSIHVKLTFLNPNGTASFKMLSGSIPEPLANRHYQININSTIDKGQSSFQILLNNKVIPVDIIDITDDISPNPTNSSIKYGELLITEIMFDPSAQSDTQGEWFEIYNNSDRTINLQNLVLVRSGTSKHSITNSAELMRGHYYVFARTATAIDVPNSYVYGTAISLPNTGAVLAIYNADSGANPGALIFSVNYGAANFPNQAGASIILNPAMVNPIAALLGASWCISSSVYSSGDKGTPGITNDSCL